MKNAFSGVQKRLVSHKIDASAVMFPRSLIDNFSLKKRNNNLRTIMSPTFQELKEVFKSKILPTNRSKIGYLLLLVAY